MAEDFKEFSREEAQGLVFHGVPLQSATVPAVQQTTTIAPEPVKNTLGSRVKSVAKNPDASSLVDTVGSAFKQLQPLTPKPEAPSSIHGLVDEITSNWKPLAVGLGLGAAAMYASRSGSKTPPSEGGGSIKRAEPTFAAEPPPPPTVAPQTSRTLEESAALANSLKPPPTPVEKAEALLGHDSPSAINRSVPPRMGPNQFTGSTAPGTFPSPAAPMGVPPAPPAPINAIPEVANPINVPDVTEKKTRLHGEEKNIRDAEIARIANNSVEIPGKPGMRANYVKPIVPPLNPETGKPWIGSGGYNYLASQVGHEAAPEAWKALYGEQNIPHKQVQADYAEARKLAGVPPKTKGGAFGTPTEIPNFIKGHATPGFLGVLAGLGLLGAAGSSKGQEAMAKAGEAIKNIGIAPEALLRGKGDELGQLGGAYVNAGNAQYKAQLEEQLKTETNKTRRSELLNELDKIKAPFKR